MSASRRWFAHLREAPPFVTGKVLGAVCITLLLCIWWLLTRGDTAEERILTPLILPSPGEVWGSVGELLDERNLIGAALASLKRVVLGFGLAVLVAVPAGVLAASWRGLEAFWAPLVLFGRNIPIAALIPLTLVWFGISETQKIMFIFIASVPFIFSDTVASVLAIPQRYVETAETLGASQFQIVRKVLVPLALPDIYTSLRFLFGLAFGYIMLAEVINADEGLGHILNVAQRRGGEPEIVILVLISIGILAYLIDRMLVFFQRGFFPYRKDI